jgi:hypothetical protein
LLFAIDRAVPILWAWYAWRAVNTGKLFDSSEIELGPNRKERPVQFWLVIAMLGFMAIWGEASFFLHKPNG